MKNKNQEIIKKLLVYKKHSEIAEMLDMPLCRFASRLASRNFTAEEEQKISEIKPLKQIVLILSSQFMKTHPRVGEPTYFKKKIESSVVCRKTCFGECEMCEKLKWLLNQKLHTIRANYTEWLKKINAVNRGEAFLRVVTWSGKPYNSPWNEVCILTKDDGIGVQEISFIDNNIDRPCVFGNGYAARHNVNIIAKNDGLALPDFKAWFKGYDLSKSMAIIHFTKFRY